MCVAYLRVANIDVLNAVIWQYVVSIGHRLRFQRGHVGPTNRESSSSASSPHDARIPFTCVDGPLPGGMSGMGVASSIIITSIISMQHAAW